LRMMLEHGLDPNAKILQTTVWKHLLDIICISLQRGLLDKSYDHSVYQIVLLALDYGADPRTVRLQDVLRWAKSFFMPVVTGGSVGNGASRTERD
jgi:hypothetical protein